MNFKVSAEFDLTQERKEEIKQWRSIYEPIFRKKRREHIKEIHELQQQESSDRNIFTEPAWFTISTTPSPKKYRLVMGFKNNGCKYWRDDPDKIGCLHCSYGSSAIQLREVTEEELLSQFGKVKRWALKHQFDFDVIEFLNDGSFFNKEELPEKFPAKLFGEIRGIPYVNRILVETRPEHIKNENEIKSLLSHLAPHQKLEIGMGIETFNDFVREFCIRKGYGLVEFENAIKCISPFKQKCSVVVYTVIKPSFLTEEEAIKDVVNTIIYLDHLTNKFDMEIIPKLEPMVVAQGSLLEILHFETDKQKPEWYKTLSYWSVLEIIARSYLLRLESNIRIGAREDMEIIEKVPAIYREDGTFNQFDFWVYDAIQRFNADHNILRLFADIQAVFEGDQENSFQSWRNGTGIETPAISICIDLLQKRIRRYRNKKKQKDREYFLHELFKALDTIELDNSSYSFAKSLKKSSESKENIKEDIELFINKAIQKILGRNYEAEINMFFFERDEREMLRVYFHLFNVSDKCVHDLWAGIPTK